MATIDGFLAKAAQAGASSVHISTGAPPLIRLHGDLLPMSKDNLNFETAKTLLMELLTDAQKEVILRTRKELDFSYASSGGYRFRVNIYRQRRGIDANFHIIPARIPTLRELQLPAIAKDVCQLNQGLILVTGSAGTGKTSTLAAMIDLINRTQQKHIITVEDPIEFVHENKMCMVNQREVGEHCRSFASALRQALRQDPDIILVGEMRDLETISMAITAAETGHLVLGTLHTLSAAKTLDRIIDVFPGHQRNQIRTMVSESIRCIICQNLLKSADGKSRILACEVLVGIASVAAQIRDAKTFQIPSIMQMNHNVGMQLMDEDLLRLLREKKVDYEEAMLHAHDPKFLLEACKKENIGPEAVDVSGKDSGKGSPRGRAQQRRG
ncbi:type IV pilus twitching motility protein PilT [bacterium]|nr:type IV pilus twitching motility protein PilT [candidate division CSSED10-310 bacterium]